MASLLDRRLICVMGKGGVGRSTVAAAIGLAAAGSGKRTIVCEVADQDRLSPLFRREAGTGRETQLTERLWATTIDPQRSLEEWLQKQVGAGLARVLGHTNAFQYLTAAAPGARELATVAKVWEVAQPERWNARSTSYDLVVVDAPSSGHALAMLRTPQTFGEIARVGPLRRQTGRIRDLLCDPGRTAYVAVALAEEMPVNETLELHTGLERDLGMGLDKIVVNALYPRRFSEADMQRLEAAAADGEPPAARAALRAARGEYSWSRGQQSQLRRLRREMSAPVITLPFLFEPELGLDALERLARELARKL